MIALVAIVCALGIAAITWAFVLLYKRAMHEQERCAKLLGDYLGHEAAERLRQGQTISGSVDGTEYRACMRHQRNRPTHFELSVAFNNRGRLLIRREFRRDVIAKRIGLAREAQTGDTAFDSRFFIETAEPVFAERWLDSPANRAAITMLADGGFEEIELESERLVVRSGRISSQSPDREKLEPDAAVLALARLRDEQPRIPEHLGRDLRWFWHLKLGFIYGFIFLVVMAGLGWEYFDVTPQQPVRVNELVVRSAKLTLLLWLCWSVICLSLLKGHSTALQHLALAAFLGLIAVFVASTIGLRYYNSVADHEVATTHVAAVVSLRRGSGRGPAKFYAHVVSWREAGATERVAVARDVFDRWRRKNGVLATITTRPGALGIEWIEAVVLHGDTRGKFGYEKSLPTYDY